MTVDINKQFFVISMTCGSNNPKTGNLYYKSMLVFEKHFVGDL